MTVTDAPPKPKPVLDSDGEVIVDETAGPPPNVYEDLTEGEKYLFAILQDGSGLDLAEFTWVNEEADDGCWRAWSFQWKWWRNNDMKQIDQCGRAIGKSESLKARACVFPFVHPGEEMVITAPEGIHVDAITERIEGQLTQTRLLQEMLVGGRFGIGHRPFKAKFRNASRILSRLPQKTGVGVKGTHPVWLEMDEGQDYPARGWTEIRETLKRDLDDAQWRVHGVTRGIPDEFYKATQEGSGWTTHHFTAMHKPTWDDAEREAKIEEYGSKDDPDYRRNVLGIHGDATNAIFVLTRLMHCVDTVEASTYNSEEFYEKKIKFEQVTDVAAKRGVGPEGYAQILIEMLELPELHKRYGIFWGGADVGIAKDPTAIMIVGEYKPDAEERRRDKAQGVAVPLDGATRLKLLARIELLRFTVPDQAEAMLHIIDFYKPRSFAIDKTGNGLGILQSLQSLANKDRTNIRVDIEDDDGGLTAAQHAEREQAKRALTIIKGYNFGGKVVVGIDETIAETLPQGTPIAEVVEKAGIKKQVKEYATDMVRLVVDTQRALLPYDTNLIQQMNGQTWTYSQSPTDAYGNRVRTFSEGQFHAFDGYRMAILGMVLHPLEQLLAAPPKKKRPVLDAFLQG